MLRILWEQRCSVWAMMAVGSTVSYGSGPRIGLEAEQSCGAELCVCGVCTNSPESGLRWTMGPPAGATKNWRSWCGNPHLWSGTLWKQQTPTSTIPMPPAFFPLTAHTASARPSLFHSESQARCRLPVNSSVMWPRYEDFISMMLPSLLSPPHISRALLILLDVQAVFALSSCL